MARGSRAGPTGHGRPLASGRISGMVEASLTATVGTTTHRLTTSKPHRAYGDGERSLGRSAAPRRIAEARILGLRTRGVALSARPTDETVPDLADIPREPHRQPGVHRDGDVVVRDERCGRRRLGLAVPSCSAAVTRRAARVYSVGGGRWASCDQPTSLGGCVAQDHLRRCTPTRCRSGKDPPWSCPVEPCALDAGLEFFTSRISRTELMFGRADPIVRRSVGISELCVTRFVISREGARLALRS